MCHFTLNYFFTLTFCVFTQSFETPTGLYGPTGKTVNLSQSQFFYAQEPVYTQKAGNRSNRGSTARFWEPQSDRFSWFPLNLNLKKKKKNTEKQKKKKHNTLSRETQYVFMFLLLLSSGHITQLPLFKNSSFGRSKL